MLKDADPDYTNAIQDAIDGAELLGKAFGEDPLAILREKLPQRRGPGSAPHSARDVRESAAAGRGNAAEANGMTRCLDCNARIPAKRLRAIPGAVRCVDCQVPHDRRVLPDDCTAMAVMGEADFEIAAIHGRDAAE